MPNYPIALTASASLTQDKNSGTVTKIDAAAGLTLTMPAASGTGNVYEVFVGTTVTSNDYIIQVASASDVFSGVLGLSTDIGGTNLLTAATTDTITMNGSTTGGLIGSYVRMVDVASGVWALSGDLKCTGVEATPFSAAVS